MATNNGNVDGDVSGSSSSQSLGDEIVVADDQDEATESEFDNNKQNHDDGGGKRSSGPIMIGNEESRRVDWMRYVLFFVLLLAAIFVSTAVFWVVRTDEEQNFEEAHDDVAQKLVDTFQANSKRRLMAIENMAITITSSAEAEKQSWPNITLNDWELRASYTLDLSDLISLFFVPIVTGENRRGFEVFASQNQQWIAEALELQGDIDKADEADELESIKIIEKTWGKSNETIPPQIITLTGTGVKVAEGDGPFAPLWLSSPKTPVNSATLYDTLSHPTRKLAIKAIIENPTNLMTKAWDFSDTNNPSTVGRKAALNLYLNRRPSYGHHYQDGPVSDLYVPVFETTQVRKCPDYLKRPCRVAGYLTGYVYWQGFLVDILPPNAKQVLVVLSNSCGQYYTYSVEGTDATYLGPGDLHDTRYDSMEVTTGYHAFLDGKETIHDVMEGQCLYKVQVYPSREMEDYYVTNEPWILTAVILTTFLATSFVFVLYDWLVQRRQQVVHSQAIKSTQVVHSLFPAAVRDRMGSGHMRAPRSSIVTSLTKTTTKTTDPATATTNATTASSFSAENSDIIADLYPNATVFFADLAGFTKWSSQREPKQVFMLLETLYTSFDLIAKRRFVFKIETIGDCYMAVTGVPRPQENHAKIMVRFAVECLAKMDQLIATKLVNLLGEETANLRLRVGMHSGPVTAGVLRGERARYQLFGDTVNTASRMESNGEPGKIQVSESTARLVIKAGKIGWLTEREGGIEAKGKGRLRTWWVDVASVGPLGRGTGSVASGLSSTSHSVRGPLDDDDAGNNRATIEQNSSRHAAPLEQVSE